MPTVFIQTNEKYPDESKRNQKIRVERSVAANAVAYGWATYCPRSSYGTKEWIEEQQQLDAIRTPCAGDANPDASEGWSVRDKTSEWDCVKILHQKNGTLTWYSHPPKDTPKKIYDEWLRMWTACQPGTVALEMERRHRAEQVHEEQQKKDRVGFARMVYTGK